MKENGYCSTNFKCFTTEQAKGDFKEKVSRLNWYVLLSHICNPDLAPSIEGFEEQNGVLFLNVDNEMISVTKNLNNPRFSN